MSLYTVLVLFSCVFTVVLTQSTSPVEILKELIEKTREKTKDVEKTNEKLREEIKVQEGKCQDEIKSIQTSASNVTDDVKKEIENLKKLQVSLTEAYFQNKKVTKQLLNETNNLNKINLELVFLQQDIDFLTRRRTSNESTNCDELMRKQQEIEGLDRSDVEDIILVLKSELDLAVTQLRESVRRRDELVLELQENKALCKKQVADQKKNLNELIRDFERAVESVRLLSEKLKKELAEIEKKREELAKVLTAEKRLKPQFQQLYAQYVSFDNDQACYKALQHDVINMYL